MRGICKFCNKEKNIKIKHSMCCSHCYSIHFFTRKKSLKEYYNDGQYVEYHRKWRQERKDDLRNRRLIKAYGITIEEYNKMYELQKGCCAICNNFYIPEELYVDHNHITGEIRGLLCRNHNFMIGLAHDNKYIFEQAIKYLSKKEEK